MSKTVSFLYQLSRIANDIEKISSGDPAKIGRRVVNKTLGKHVIRHVYLRGGRRW